LRLALALAATPDDRQSEINERHGEQADSAASDPRRPGSRSLEAGGEFLKALASDLAAVASRLRLPATVTRRRTPPPAPSPISSQISQGPKISQGPTIGRMLWRVGIAIFGFVSIAAGALAAVTLWVLVGSSPQPQRSPSDILGSQFEARKGEAIGGAGPLNVTGGARTDIARGSDPHAGAEAKAASPLTASSGSSTPPHADKGGALPAASEPQMATNEQQAGTALGVDQPQPASAVPADHPPAGRLEALSTPVTDLPTPLQCNVDACAGKYASFHAADCTYQPHGGGPRRVCEQSPKSAAAQPQPRRAATDLTTEANADSSNEAPKPAKHKRLAEDLDEAPERAGDTQIAESPAEVTDAATLARAGGAGGQCNVKLCAAGYASFRAADCTYQPHDGGPRRLCER
jgi:hypothetical protein